MTIQQIIDEHMKELYRSVRIYGTINNHIPRETKDTIRSITRKLIEAVGEEVIDKDEANVDDDDDKDWDIIKRNGLRAEQRLKLKEIINSLK